MAEIGIHTRNEPWPSLEWASWLFDRASFMLVATLVVGAISTVVIVWMGIVKEHHWDLAREYAAKEIEGTKLEIAKANRETAIARLATEQLRLRLVSRMIDPEPRKRIVEKLRSYTGQKFSIFPHSEADPEATNLALNLRETLQDAGWSWTEVPPPTQPIPDGVRYERQNSGDLKFNSAVEALLNSLHTDAGLYSNGYTSGGQYEGIGPIVVILIGKKPPSPMEIPALSPHETK